METSYSVKNTSEFGCEFLRGAHSDDTVLRKKLTILNHFLTIAVPTPYLATKANSRAEIEHHFALCRHLWNRMPNFVAVDYWTLNQPIRTIDFILRSVIFK